MLVLYASCLTDGLVSCFQDGVCDLFHKTTCSMEINTFFGFSLGCLNKLFCNVRRLVLSGQLCIQVSSISCLSQL